MLEEHRCAAGRRERSRARFGRPSAGARAIRRTAAVASRTCRGRLRTRARCAPTSAPTSAWPTGSGGTGGLLRCPSQAVLRAAAE
eukprot:2125254-Alexandrium_andersonii.AAC.1